MTTALGDPTTGRRERKKAETRQRIRRAALALARQRGVARATVDDISEAADVSPRTFFNYFASKEDALVADTHELADRLHAAIVGRPADEDALQVLRQAMLTENAQRSAAPERAEVRERYQLVRDNPELLPRHLHHFAMLEIAIESGMRHRLAVTSSEDLRPALLGALGVAVLRLATHRWAERETADWAEVVESAFDLLERGFG